MKLKIPQFLFVLLFYSVSSLAAENTSVKTIKAPIDPLSGTNIFQMVAGLLLVLMLVMVIAWMVRRVGGVSLTGGSALSVIGGMSMGARERIVLLQVGEEQILIGVSPGRIQKLHILDKPIEIKNKKTVSINFAEKLTEILKGRNK